MANRSSVGPVSLNAMKALASGNLRLDGQKTVYGKANTVTTTTSVTSTPTPPEKDKSPTGSNDPGAKLSASQVSELQANLEDPSEYVRNPLGDYDGVAYHWRMFMTQDLETAKVLNSAVGTSDVTTKKVFEALDSQPKTIIAESGVTTGFNIQDVRMEQVVGPSFQNRNVNTTKITMTIVEPLGTSFLEKIKNAAINLKIKNFNKVFYYLELTFKGYDTKGNPVNPAETMGDGEPLPNGGRWVYQVQIVDIQTQLDTSGSTYVLTCIPYNEGAYREEIMQANKTHVAGGRTIGEFLDNLRDYMNEDFAVLYGKDFINIDFKTHPIRHSLFKDEDPRNWPIAPQQGEMESERCVGFDGLTAIKFDKGAALSDIIEFVFANTEKGQQIAKDVARRNDQDQDSDKSTLKRFRECVLFRIEPDIDITGYSPLFSNYKRKVTFHIWAYATQAPVISEKQKLDALKPQIQVQMVNELKKKGFLRKRYDYYFTGMNTEVLRLDVKYNLAWTAVLPLTLGDRATIESMSVGATYDENLQIASSKTSTINKLLAESESLTTELYGSTTQPGLVTPNQEGSWEEVAAKRKRLDEVNQQLSTLTAERDRAQSAAEAEMFKRDQTATSQKQDYYAEDLRDIPDTSDLPLHISFSYVDTAKQTGTGTTPAKSADRGYYGAILEQLYGPVTTGLITIDLEIRGDPYWIGYSNLERKEHMADTPPDLAGDSIMPNTQEGDCAFLLHFDFPYDIDPETGEPLFRRSGRDERLDTFNGLYRTVRAVHTFAGGQFTTTLSASRLPLIDVARVLGYKGGIDTVDSVVTPSSNAISGSKTPGKSGIANPGTAPTISGNIQDRANQRVDALLKNDSKRAIAEEIYNDTRARGYTHPQALGVVANAMAESSLNPKANIVDSNGYRSYGLFQLNGNGVGKGQNVDYMLTRSGNTNLILNEAQARGKAFAASTTPGQAASNFMKEVERPSDPDGSKARERAALAEALTKYNFGS